MHKMVKVFEANEKVVCSQDRILQRIWYSLGKENVSAPGYNQVFRYLRHMLTMFMAPLKIFVGIHNDIIAHLEDVLIWFIDQYELSYSKKNGWHFTNTVI
ncbi:hypothetical protein RF11_12331 [Thelohanellus kitauei]|uniref:Uncharacterized protein n=1 Tax=Thelohanellus kitauei TaxID=669202 RepID=A0A0C2MDZ6_THEKT|nr:hypothetical protein RF11_12331 [Thelohanellus kitauei]